MGPGKLQAERRFAPIAKRSTPTMGRLAVVDEGAAMIARLR
jgi:hypothetical protein